MKMLSFILVLLLGGFMPAGNLSAADKKQNPHHITVKNSRDLQAYFRYSPDRPIVISGHRGGMLDGYAVGGRCHALCGIQCAGG